VPKQQKEDRLYDLIKDLDRAYDRTRYYNDPPKDLVEKFDYWRKEARESWNTQDSDGDFNASEKEDLIDQLTSDLRKEERAHEKEKKSHAKLKEQFSKIEKQLEHELNDNAMLLSAMLSVLGSDKLDAVLKHAKTLGAEFDNDKQGATQ